MRKIAIVTGTRAEYGLLYWIIKGVNDVPELQLQLIVTGMHLSHEFGMTVREIEKDGFSIAERVDMLLSSDSEPAIATSMGVGIIGFAKAYERLKPNLLVVLGDRFEIFSAVTAALPFRFPIAHIHGGESSEGAIDESIRHAITKMSHIHFTSTETYRNRVIQMGEPPDRVFCYGAPGIDNINRLKLIKKKQLLVELDIPEDKRLGIVTYHPVTLEKGLSESHIFELLKALKIFTDIYWIFTFPNADNEGRIIIERIKNFVGETENRGKVFKSLGQLRYLSLLKHSDLMVGNSSSGLIEAPSFKLPVVNIGNRQKGRVRGRNIIDVQKCEREFIIKAISKALSEEFKDSLENMKNPYGDGNVSDKIVEVLKTHPLSDILQKTFFDYKI